MPTLAVTLKLAHYAILLSPLGQKFEHVRIDCRDASKVRLFSNYVYGYRMFDVYEGTAVVNGAEVKISSEPFNESGRFLQNGTIKTPTDLRAENNEKLAREVEELPNQKAVFFPNGFWVPFEDNDQTVHV